MSKHTSKKDNSKKKTKFSMPDSYITSFVKIS